MQVPIRKSEQSRHYTDDGGPVYLTAAGIKRLEATLCDLEKNQLPQAIAEVQRTGAMGDFSENAAYQDAKGRLRRINSRIAVLKDRLNRVQVITRDQHNTSSIRLGSTVTLKINGAQKTYEIVGPAETDPERGRISHVSPLGAALIGHVPGDEIRLMTGDHEAIYTILEIR